LTTDQRHNKLLVHNFLNTTTGTLVDAERRALASALIEMEGVTDWMSNQRLFLRAVRRDGLSERQVHRRNDQKPEWAASRTELTRAMVVIKAPPRPNGSSRSFS
jgi:hypothetical protein